MEIKPVTLLVVSLGKAFNEMPLCSFLAYTTLGKNTLRF